MSAYEQLLTLDDYATQRNVAPSFAYSGDIDRLEQIAPVAAGRFKLRSAIDRLRASMEGSTMTQHDESVAERCDRCGRKILDAVAHYVGIIDRRRFCASCCECT